MWVDNVLESSEELKLWRVQILMPDNIEGFKDWCSELYKVSNRRAMQYSIQDSQFLSEDLGDDGRVPETFEFMCTRSAAQEFVKYTKSEHAGFRMVCYSISTDVLSNGMFE